MTLLPVVFAFVLFAVAVRGTKVESVTHAEFNGIVAYFPVAREAIQKKLDEFHNSRFPGVHAKRFHLPDSQPFPDLLSEDQHPVFIGVGHITDLDFLGEQSLVTNWTQFAITIPFLTNGSSPVPDYSLVVENFYQRNDKLQVVDPNFAFPLTPIDDVYLSEGIFVARDDDEFIVLSLKSYTDPCQEVAPVTRHEFEVYHSDVKQMGAEEPHFETCKSHPRWNRFCSVVREVGDDVTAEVPNFCQTAWKSEHIESCDATVDAVVISPGFRDLLLLGPDEGPDFVVAETDHGFFDIGLKYPCF